MEKAVSLQKDGVTWTACVWKQRAQVIPTINLTEADGVYARDKYGPES